MPIQKEQSEIVVLGGGPGGYVAALVAAQRGARVILVEKARVGGTCLNIGCIPTKALTTSMDLLLRSRRACEFGLSIPRVDVDLPALMTYKRNTVDELVGGVENLLKARHIKVICGEARLIKPDTLFIDDGKGGQWELSANHIILAPGSVATTPPIEGCTLPGVLTSTSALDIDAVPDRLVVVGGGVIGLEFACIYEALGSKVTLLEMTKSLLPGATDEVIAKRLQILLGRRGMDIRTGTVVRKIERTGEVLRVFTEAAGSEAMLECDRVLVATGRRPNTQNLGFTEAGIKMNGPAIAVDESLATSLTNVWAAGDATGGWMLAHKAMVDGRVAAENATGGSRRTDYHAVPNVIFTRPEIASVGMTELQAREKGMDVKVSQFSFSANPRARILRESDGFARLVCDAGSGRIIGMHMIGPHVTDIVAEGVLAVQMGITADDLAWTMHAHPTLPEATLEAALGFRNAAIHSVSR